MPGSDMHRDLSAAHFIALECLQASVSAYYPVMQLFRRYRANTQIFYLNLLISHRALRIKRGDPHQTFTNIAQVYALDKIFAKRRVSLWRPPNSASEMLHQSTVCGDIPWIGHIQYSNENWQSYLTWTLEYVE
ncbi:hypothetical protein Plhal304r1_c013g0049721 [Plasmopara halstedii]